MLGDAASNDCTLNSTSILSKADCGAAATALGLTDSAASEGVHADQPRGCFATYATDGGLVLRFNTHSSGSAAIASVPICRRGCTEASTLYTNGVAGDCTEYLAAGASCQPQCNSGFTVSGTTNCGLIAQYNHEPLEATCLPTGPFASLPSMSFANALLPSLLVGHAHTCGGCTPPADFFGRLTKATCRSTTTGVCLLAMLPPAVLLSLHTPYGGFLPIAFYRSFAPERMQQHSPPTRTDQPDASAALPLHHTLILCHYQTPPCVHAFVFYDRPGQRYMLGAKHADECPAAESAEITTSEDCGTAAAALGLTDSGAEAISDAAQPSGCFAIVARNGQLELRFNTNVYGSSHTYDLVGDGYCRGPGGSSQRVNGRVRCGLSSETDCASECTASSDCGGYAFAATTTCAGTCFLYGPNLDSGLTAYTSPGSTTEWEGDSRPNTDVVASSGKQNVVCKKKKPGACWIICYAHTTPLHH